MEISQLLEEFKRIEQIKDIDVLISQYKKDDLKQLYKYTNEYIRNIDLLFQQTLQKEEQFNSIQNELLKIWKINIQMYKFSNLLLKALHAIERNEIIQQTEDVVNKLNQMLDK